MTSGDTHFEESSSLISKRAMLLVKYIQLLYQDVYGHVAEFWEHQASEQQKESARKESFDRSTLLTTSDCLQQQPNTADLEEEQAPEEDTSADLSIQE